MRRLYQFLIGAAIVLVIGLVLLGLYLGGVFDTSGTKSGTKSGTETTEAAEPAADATARAATVRAAATAISEPPAPTPNERTRGIEQYPTDMVLTGDAGYGKRVLRDADVLVVNSNRKTYQYRGGDLISERVGVYFGDAGVVGKKAKIGDRDIYEDETLVRPLAHDDVFYYFLHTNAVAFYDSDTRERSYIYRGNRIVDAYMGPESLVILLENEVRGYIYYEDSRGFMLARSVNVTGGICLAQFKEESFLIGFENRVELYDSDYNLAATLRPPEPADSFGSSTAFYCGRIYVGAPRQKTVYVFAKVDDLWLPYAAYSRDSPDFGRSVEAGPDAVYIASSDRVYVI